jgi:hypothetical protein
MLSRLMLCAAISPWAFCSTQVKILEREIGDSVEIRERLDSLANLHLRQPSGPWETLLTEVGKSSINRVLAPAPSDLIGITVRKIGEDDALVSAWKTDSPGFSRIWVLDEPEYNWFVLESDPHQFESPESIRAFWNRTIAWATDGVPLAQVELTMSRGSGRFLLAGTGRINPNYAWGGEVEVYAVRTSTGAVFALKCGKQLFSGYPSEARYVPERFPPLAGRIATWKKQDLFDQIGRMKERTGPIRHFANRDSILIAEIVRRGLTDNDFDKLFSPPVGDYDDTFGFRVDSTIKAIVSSGQLETHRASFEAAVLRLGLHDRDDNRFALTSVFAVLTRHLGGDYSDLALTCLKTCVLVRDPLQYLEDRGTTEEAYNTLLHISVPRDMETQRQATLESVRQRISSRKQGAESVK